MFKTLKKAISILLIASFVLSLVPIGAFAEITIPPKNAAVAPKPWTGNNAPNASMKYAGEDAAVTTGLWTSVKGKLTHASELAYSDGTFGKKSGDMVYLVRDNSTRTTSDLTQHGSYFSVGLKHETTDNLSDFAVKFSFALTDPDDVISVMNRFYLSITDRTNDKNKKNLQTSISQTGVKFSTLGSASFETPLELNRWYNATLIFDLENKSSGEKTGSYTWKLYINGELYGSTTIKNGYYINGYVRLGTTNVGNSESVLPDNWVHYDNIDSFAIPSDGSYHPTEPTASTLSSSDRAVEFRDTTIEVPDTYTIKYLREAITSSKQDDVIRFYNSDYSALKSDNDPAINTNVVIASLQNGVETTFSYYTVKKWIKQFPGINKGTSVYKPDSTKTGWQRMESVSTPLGGKAGDNYLLWADSSGAPYRAIPVGDAAGSRDVLEMQVYVPAGSSGIHTGIRLSSMADTAVEWPVLIKPDGLYLKWKNISKIHNWEPNKWYTLAFVTPKEYIGTSSAENNLINSNEVEIYVNGELVDKRGSTFSKVGFRYIRATASGAGISEPSIYLDNIRVHSNPYEPQYDALAQIDYVDGIDEDNNIIVKGAITVAELKKGITKAEDTNIRVLSSLTSTEVLSDGDIVQSGNVVVVAAMNNSEMERSYNYYTIDRIKQEVKINTLVNGATGILYKETDTISINTTYTNYSDESQDVIMYTAQYKNGELIKLWQKGEITVEAGATQNLTCDFAGIEKIIGTSIKVMVMDPDTLTPYANTKTMRHNAEDTKATLYLIGDSIVQEYVDIGYPIQGWGKYIGEYLNDNITVENRATSGWTTDHYLYPDGIYTRRDGVREYGTYLRKPLSEETKKKKAWSSILNELKDGDYVMVSLGINDSGSGNVPSDAYLENITTIYDQATAKGATVVFSTPTISGKEWDKGGSFGAGWASYGEICAKLAKDNGTVCIPLGATLVKKYNDMSDEYLAEHPEEGRMGANNYVRNYFHMYGKSGTIREGIEDFGANELGNPGFGSLKSDDSTHHNYLASEEIAGIVAELLKNSDSPLGDYVK